MAGLLVTIEGGEGTGKTTQIRRLTHGLAALGVDVLSTREPGGAPGAEALRGFLLGKDHGLGLRAEAMAHFAARVDHVDTTIGPALAAGRLVLCDRFYDSTLAYQGYGLGHGEPALLGFIGSLIDLLAVRPRLTLMLDVPLEEAQARRRQRGREQDRYEALDEAFHARVAEGYRSIARLAPERCVLIQASGSIDDVQQRLVQAVRPLLAT